MEMKLRTIKLNLTDDDVRRLSKKAAVCGLTASEILENFISDLTWGDNAHGVNEKFYAGSWFVAWRSSTQPEMSFLRYLTEHGQLESILKSMSSEAQNKEKPLFRPSGRVTYKSIPRRKMLLKMK